MVTNLAEQLRQGTTKSHSMAENVSFVPRILIPISFIISEETFTPWVFILIDRCEDGLFQFLDAFPPISAFLFWIDDALVISM